jgi:hypothetical protein
MTLTVGNDYTRAGRNQNDENVVARAMPLVMARATLFLPHSERFVYRY